MTDALQGLSVEELRVLVGELMHEAGERAVQGLRAQRPSRRRPRRDQPVGLVVRIDLVSARPATWRRVELPSTLMLDEVHELLQLLFGWTDSHLHRFALGASVWDRDAELFLCPYDVEEGEDDGLPTSAVRLDEVLGEVGDKLRYVYDYGDDWMLVLKLERVDAAPPPRARVTGGRRGAPPDDYGGIWAWNEAEGEAPFDRAALDEAVAARCARPRRRRRR